jgi:pyridoxal phosphate phosphatase PHOSPHO2
MSDLVSATITNGALFDETGRLRVSSYHDITKPHGCVNLCKANMCKGLALSKIRKPSHSRVCYVGDGFVFSISQPQIGGDDSDTLT